MAAGAAADDRDCPHCNKHNICSQVCSHRNGARRIFTHGIRALRMIWRRRASNTRRARIYSTEWIVRL